MTDVKGKRARFPIGTIVQLNSGGSTFLVCDFDLELDRVTVGWYGPGGAFEDNFPAACFRLVKPSRL